VEVVSLHSASPGQTSFLLVFSDATAAYVELETATGQPSRVEHVALECGGPGHGPKGVAVEAAMWLETSCTLLLLTGAATGVDSAAGVHVFRCQFPMGATAVASVHDAALSRGPPLTLSVDPRDDASSGQPRRGGAGGGLMGYLLGHRQPEVADGRRLTTQLSMPVAQLAASPDERLVLVVFADGAVTLLGLGAQPLTVLSERFLLQPLPSPAGTPATAAATGDGGSHVNGSGGGSGGGEHHAPALTPHRLTSAHFLSPTLLAAATADGRIDLVALTVAVSSTAAAVSVAPASHLADALPPPLGPCCVAASHLAAPAPAGPGAAPRCRLVVLRAVDAWTSQLFYMTSMTPHEALACKLREGLYEEARALAGRIGADPDVVNRERCLRLLRQRRRRGGRNGVAAAADGTADDQSSDAARAAVVEALQAVRCDEWVLEAASSFVDDDVSLARTVLEEGLARSAAAAAAVDDKVAPLVGRKAPARDIAAALTPAELLVLSRRRHVMRTLKVLSLMDTVVAEALQGASDADHTAQVLVRPLFSTSCGSLLLPVCLRQCVPSPSVPNTCRRRTTTGTWTWR